MDYVLENKPNLDVCVCVFLLTVDD